MRRIVTRLYFSNSYHDKNDVTEDEIGDLEVNSLLVAQGIYGSGMEISQFA